MRKKTEQAEEQAVEQVVEPKQEAVMPKKKLPKMNSQSIANLYGSWGCFKNLGAYGMPASEIRLRLIDTDYVMSIPIKAEHPWQVKWRKVGFVEISNSRRQREDRPSSFKEMMANVPEELRTKFEENIELFLVPKK